MLTKLMALTRAELKSKLASIDVSAVKGRGLRRKFEAIRNKKQGGFTLLELLVVVAILAAIAGTATIMLQDTDRKGAAAAHVAMMDELSKGIQTFRVLNSGLYPDVWDSLLHNSADSALPTTASDDNILAIISDDLKNYLSVGSIDSVDLKALNTAGIYRVRVAGIDEDFDTAANCNLNDTEGDAGIGAIVRSKLNDVTPQNIFRSADANGCGWEEHHVIKSGDSVVYWDATNNVRAGVPQQIADSTRLVAFGVGPDSTLFDPAKIGALSNVPVYRHVASDEYNRFIVLWNLNPATETIETDEDGAYDKSTYRSAGGQASFQAIIDGAGDTKDEELGEVDNVRPT
ncbi:MAG: type II secretion system GspH family protein [Zoogloeaceae bacterium]|jgi:prepilin-type N-terminal cleavage/methylation domain-containing protein|nr:type II secretion system GspH family protein [Zoogloeaceae bacterium]